MAAEGLENEVCIVVASISPSEDAFLTCFKKRRSPSESDSQEYRDIDGTYLSCFELFFVSSDFFFF